jgi:hypothetical protein
MTSSTAGLMLSGGALPADRLDGITYIDDLYIYCLTRRRLGLREILQRFFDANDQRQAARDAGESENLPYVPFGRDHDIVERLGLDQFENGTQTEAVDVAAVAEIEDDAFCLFGDPRDGAHQCRARAYVKCVGNADLSYVFSPYY